MDKLPNSSNDPVVQVVTELIDLRDQIFDRFMDETETDEEINAVDWIDPTTSKQYSLRSGFRGDVVVLETTGEDWENGTTYRAGSSGLTISTNEKLSAGLTFQERFQPVIDAMRAKLQAED